MLFTMQQVDFNHVKTLGSGRLIMQKNQVPLPYSSRHLNSFLNKDLICSHCILAVRKNGEEGWFRNTWFVNFISTTTLLYLVFLQNGEQNEKKQSYFKRINLFLRTN